jgi:chemotaxis protein methyltransferase CheR
LGLQRSEEYTAYLQSHPEEWKVLDSFCFATISKFYRDRRVFDLIGEELLPAIATRKSRPYEQSDLCIRVWSAGSCSGEEPYTVSIIWMLSVRPAFEVPVALDIVATEYKGHLIERAQQAVYPYSSIKELPRTFLERAFHKTNGDYQLEQTFKSPVRFVQQDIREELPGARFDIILCRNLVFTYFETSIQEELLEKIIEILEPGGYLIVGEHEQFPRETPELVRHPRCSCIYQVRSPRI